MIRILARATLAVAAFATPAFAHVTLETPQAAIGATYKAVLRVPHGCGGAATTAIHIQIPPGFFNVKPMPKPGWTLETVTGPYAAPYDDHGTMRTEGVTEIVWKDGNLPDAWYDEFVFRGSVAATLAPGPLYFPTVQDCGADEAAWIDVSGDAAADMPAPGVELVAAPPAGH